MKKAFLQWVDRNLEATFNQKRLSGLTSWAQRTDRAHETTEMLEYLLKNANMRYAGWFLREIKFLGSKSDKVEQDEIGKAENLLALHIADCEDVRTALSTAVLFSSNYEMLYQLVKKFDSHFNNKYINWDILKKKYASTLVDCIRVSGDSDPLFIVLRALYECNYMNHKFIPSILKKWGASNGSLFLPKRDLGRESLSILYRSLINGHWIRELNTLHGYFPELKISDIYKMSIDELAPKLIKWADEDFQVYVFLRNAYVKECDRETGFYKWKKLVMNTSLAQEDWFIRYIFLQHMKTDCSEETIRKYSFPNNPTLYYKDVVSESTWKYLISEITSIFPRVLSARPDLVYTFLEMILPINEYSYRQPKMTWIKGRRIRDYYSAYSFYDRIPNLLASVYDLKDTIRIYINSPLHCAISWTVFIEQLMSVYGSFNIKDTPFSRIAVTGVMTVDSSGELLLCANKRDQNPIRLYCDLDHSALEQTASMPYTHVIGELENYIPGKSVELSSADIFESPEYDIHRQILALRAKRLGAQGAILQAYQEIKNQRKYNHENLSACAAQLDNAPYLSLQFSKQLQRDLAIAQAKAFLALADRPEELKELIQLTNILAKGKLNLFREDPFGENGFRLEAEEYQIALAELKPDLSENAEENVYDILNQALVPPEAVLEIYMNTILKRMIPLKEILRLMLRKINLDARAPADVRFDVFGSLFYRIYTGKVKVIDRETGSLRLAPQSFNRGTMDFIYTPPQKKYFTINNRHYFIMESFNLSENTCRLKMVSTKKALEKAMPIHAFRCALMAETSQPYYMKYDEITKMLSVELGVTVFQEPWYIDEYRFYFNAHLEGGQNVLGALEKLGANNAFQDGNDCDPAWFDSCRADASLYRDYLRRVCANAHGTHLVEAVQVFWNSPIRGVIPLEEVFAILTSSGHVPVERLVTAFYDHPVAIKETSSAETTFSNIFCRRFILQGDPLSQHFFITDYNSETGQVVFSGN